MKRLFQSVALLLLALWLPATLHCDLEAAELWVEHAEDHAAVSDSCCQAGLGCTQDGCDTLEGSAVKSSGTFARAPLPAPFVCCCLICLPPAEPASLLAAVPIQYRLAPELDWVPIVHFARRAAPLSRAPSFVGC
ncbi:MAG: hypothetical protein IPN11_07305 [Opitutaceae bacterium]|nr:hypothetical protein [Opitutaceae bacterium]